MTNHGVIQWMQGLGVLRCRSSYISLADTYFFKSVQSYSSCTFLFWEVSWLPSLNLITLSFLQTTSRIVHVELKYNILQTNWSLGPAFLYLSAKLIPPFFSSLRWKYYITLHTSFKFFLLLLTETVLRNHIIKAILQDFFVAEQKITFKKDKSIFTFYFCGKLELVSVMFSED